MSYQAGRSKRRFRPQYVYSIISIALVLFMLGLLGIIVVHAQKVSEYFRENIQISLILKDDVNETEALQLQNKIEAEPYIRSTEYISKDKAAERLQDDLGENFMDLLEYNPLYASLDVYLKANYVSPDSLKWIEGKFTGFKEVKEVYYQKGLVEVVSKNIRSLSLVIAALSLLLFLIVVTLIDNTLRLSMYSNRFLIKSMQMVGATRWFIIKPFIGRAFFNGFISGLLAVLALVGLLYYVQKYFPDLVVLDDLVTFATLFAVIILTGVLISVVSTHLAVRKYLKMKLDDLY